MTVFRVKPMNVALLALYAVNLGACAEPFSPTVRVSGPATVQITPSLTALKAGETAQLRAIQISSDGRQRDVNASWSTDNHKS
jgi:hypothetical protein